MNLLDFSNAQKLKYLINEVSKLAALEEGWLDGEGSAISPGSAVTANSFFMHCYNAYCLNPKDHPFFSQCKFYVYPVENGNISVEFEYGGTDWLLETGSESWRLHGVNMATGEEFAGLDTAAEFMPWDYCLTLIQNSAQPQEST